jgi:multidrug efflux pump
MTLPTFCIKRPVFTLVLSFVLIVFGAISFFKLPVQQLPNINRASVTISTTLNGASPHLIEQEITTPIENRLASISGIDEVNSQSMLSQSMITVSFKNDTNISDAISEIRDKMSAMIDSLPNDTKAPVVRKNDGNTIPTIMIGFIDPTRSPELMTDTLNRDFKPSIEEVNGVGEVFFMGGRSYEIKIHVDPNKMAARHISVSDIREALQQQNMTIPSGQIKSKARNYTIVTHTQVDKAADIGKIIINDSHGYLTRLNDIASLVIESDEENSLFRINGQSAVGLGVIAQATANPVVVSKDVKAQLKKYQAELPDTTKAITIFDSATYINHAVTNVYHSLIEAVLLVGLIILLFLGNIRASLIPIITVPICLIAVFYPMSLLGFSINIVTLLALVLAIGLVVDDAIVVLENNYRHMQKGLPRKEAAILGSKEVVFAVIAMTLTLTSVYAPLQFIDGFTGKLFVQFGFTLASAVIISGLIALTLSPMMCAHTLSLKPNRYSLWLDKFFDSLRGVYHKSLLFVLNKKKYVIALLILLIALTGYLYQVLPKTLAPNEDQGYIFTIITPPTDSSREYTDNYSKQVESLYQPIKEKRDYLSFVNPGSGFSALILKPWGERQGSQESITTKLNQQLQHIEGIDAFAMTPAPLGRRHNNNSGLSLRISSNASYEELNNTANFLVDALKQYKGLSNVKNNLRLNSNQFEITFNKQSAYDLGVRLSDIADTLSSLLGGSNPINYNYQGQSYPVKVQLAKMSRTSISTLDDLFVQSTKGKNIPLAQLIKVKEITGPDSLTHVARQRSAMITAEISSGSNISDAIKTVREIMHEKLPEGTHFSFTGSAKDYLSSNGQTAFAFFLALLFIFLVLSAQFESFVSPFIIMLTVPLTLAGALLTLYFTNSSLNIYSNIGMLTLIGLISKHGILITEFANKIKQSNVTPEEAIIKAASLRLRPILMTTMAMVLGALPLALSSGAGAEANKQIGYVIIGGMLFGTFLTLFVIPVAYSLLTKNKLAN